MKRLSIFAVAALAAVALTQPAHAFGGRRVVVQRQVVRQQVVVQRQRFVAAPVVVAPVVTHAAVVAPVVAVPAVQQVVTPACSSFFVH